MRLKQSLQPTFLVFIKLLAVILVVNLLFGISLALFDLSFAQNLFIYNPLLNGFIHSDWEHLFYNTVVLFIVLIPEINRSLGLSRILFFTVCISLICFPFILADITLPIIGISGLYYFLLTRLIYSRKKNKIVIRGIFLLFVFSEISATGNQDDISHFCHLVGIFLGIMDSFKNGYIKMKVNQNDLLSYKSLFFFTFLLHSMNSGAQISSSNPHSFKSDLIEFVDEIVCHNAPKLVKNINFLEGMRAHVLETKYQNEPIQFSNKKAHYHQITYYGGDKEFTELFSVESLGMTFIKETYSAVILNTLNHNFEDDSDYDAYCFDIININNTDYLVFSMGYQNALEKSETYIDDFWNAMK